MKKILSLALAAVMLVSVLPVAYAADVDYTAGTQVEYAADADANRAYTITVPAKMTPKLGEAVTGTVTLSGTWASNETVTVTADEKVTLTNSINANDTHDLAITFPKMEYAGDNTEAKTYTETVTLAEMPAAALFGEWTGKFNYNVEFDDGILIRFDGLYVNTTDEKDMLQFYEDGRVQVDGGSFWTGFTYKGDKIYNSSGEVAYTLSADGATLTPLMYHPEGTLFQYTTIPEVVTFTLVDKEYECDWKMTLADWIDSEYNTDGFTRVDNGDDGFYVKAANGKYVGTNFFGEGRLTYKDNSTITPYGKLGEIWAN